MQFTTPTPPTVTTTAASSLTNTSGYLNGSANPNGSTTTGWFRYSLTNPGACDDVFGSRAPVAGGIALGAGVSAVGYSQQITGLSAGTTYYFCAIAQSAEGTAFGSILLFTTPTTPVTTTSAATLITPTTATLNGAANPSGDSNGAYGYFRYATSNPGLCNDLFGTRAPPSSASDTYLGTGTSSVAFSRAIAGLTPATTYYFCAIGRNTYGTTFGTVLSFTTQANLPVVTTNSASLLTGTTAQLNGSANPGGAATTGWFRYATASPGTCNDTFGTRSPAAGGSALGSGNVAVNFLQGITGLTAGTTYYYCAIASNSIGTAFGAVVQFTTPLAARGRHGGRVEHHDQLRFARRRGHPQRLRDDGLLPLQPRPIPARATTCSARARRRRAARAGLRLFERELLADGLGAVGGDDVLLLRDRPERRGDGVRRGDVVHDAQRADGDDTGGDARHVELGDAERIGEPQRQRDVRLLPLQHDQPWLVQRRVRNARAALQPSDTYLGTGTSSVAYSRSIAGLTPATTYYYCAIAYNSYGTRSA